MRAETAGDPLAGRLGTIAGGLPPGPRDGEVHAWGIPVDAPPAPVELLRSVLSADERERAGRFRFEDDRRRYIVGRGVLRILLGHCVGIEPQRLTFGYGPHGKPFLAPPAGPVPLEFNVSHSGRWVLIGITRGRTVGVDLERIRPVEDLEAIAVRHFTATEAAGILSFTGERRTAAFFACWTRKEAYIKADGAGLSEPLDRFEVSVLPEDAIGRVRVGEASGGPTRWTFWSLLPEPGYLAAVVAVAPESALVARKWSSAGIASWSLAPPSQPPASAPPRG